MADPSAPGTSRGDQTAGAEERRITRSLSRSLSGGGIGETGEGTRRTDPAAQVPALQQTGLAGSVSEVDAELQQLQRAAEAAAAAALQAVNALAAAKARQEATTGVPASVPTATPVIPTLQQTSGLAGQETQESLRLALQALWNTAQGAGTGQQQPQGSARPSTGLGAAAFEAQVSGSAGRPWVPPAQAVPGAVPASQVVKVQPAPRLTEKTYLSYRTWAGKFEFWVKPQG